LSEDLMNCLFMLKRKVNSHKVIDALG